MQLDRLGNISGGNKPLLREFEGHKGDITTVRWSRNGLVVLSASDDSTIHIGILRSPKFAYLLTRIDQECRRIFVLFRSDMTKLSS